MKQPQGDQRQKNDQSNQTNKTGKQQSLSKALRGVPRSLRGSVIRNHRQGCRT